MLDEGWWLMRYDDGRSGGDARDLHDTPIIFSMADCKASASKRQNKQGKKDEGPMAGGRNERSCTALISVPSTVDALHRPRW